MLTINERFEILKGDIGNLRNEVKDIKETLMQQNELIINLLLTQTGTPLALDKAESNLNLSAQTGDLVAKEDSKKNSVDTYDDSNFTQFTRMFPLKTLKDLNKFEKEINDENKELIVSVIKNLLTPDGIYRKIANVLSYNIIMESNVNGRHYKTNLLNFPKTMDILFLASRTDDSDGYINYNQFLDELKRSIRLAQNRHHTRNCSIKRKLVRQGNTKELEHYQLVKSCSIVRTQETYFPPYS